MSPAVSQRQEVCTQTEARTQTECMSWSGEGEPARSRSDAHGAQPEEQATLQYDEYGAQQARSTRQGAYPGEQRGQPNQQQAH